MKSGRRNKCWNCQRRHNQTKPNFNQWAQVESEVEKAWTRQTCWSSANWVWECKEQFELFQGLQTFRCSSKTVKWNESWTAWRKFDHRISWRQSRLSNLLKFDGNKMIFIQSSLGLAVPYCRKAAVTNKKSANRFWGFHLDPWRDFIEIILVIPNESDHRCDSHPIKSNHMSALTGCSPRTHTASLVNLL